MLYKKLKDAFPNVSFQENFILSKITYFKVGGPAEVFVEVYEEETCVNLVNFCRQHNFSVTFLGGASNVIVSDDGISGLVMRYANQDLEVLEQNDTEALVQVSSGIKMATLVSKTVALGLTGLEYFLGVPGMLGGAIYNNAHYLSDLMGKHIHSVKVLNTQGDVEWLDHEVCDFAYDHSRFQKSGEIILAAKFLLRVGEKSESQRLIREATEYRAKTQPLGMPSSGCIFQNTPNTEHLKELFPQFQDREFVPSGFIIDQAGLKGEKIGGIEVSEKHAAFFINTGDGTAEELQQLISKVKRSVYEKFGVELQEEVFYL